MKQHNNIIIPCTEQIAKKCVYGQDFVKEIFLKNNYPNIYEPKQDYTLSSKKVEGFQKLAEQREYYQQNPTRFIKDFFNIQLLDSQAYLMQQAWNKDSVLITASRAYGKSFWSMLFVMAKQMLSSSAWNCYIAAGSSSQSATTFKKLQDIANDRIDSLLNSNGRIFKDEVEISAANGDGFSHNPSGFEYHLYNASFLRSLNSNVDKNRGQRSNCVIFDETSFLDANLIRVYQAFCALDTNFKTGVSDNGKSLDLVGLYSLPKQIPNQLIYISSASSVDSEFYRMYREFAKRMIAGDPNYFVADIDCQLVMKPTIDGKAVRSGLTREKIDAAMAVNPLAARREYYNQFISDAGDNAIIKRGAITRNEETRAPLLYNDTKDKKFIITYDPARSNDNSIVLVGELYEDKLPNGEPDLKVRIVNCINLLDVAKKNKTPLRMPEQIAELRKIVLRYNGGADNYDNIVGIWTDSGAGGGGVMLMDGLMQDWVTPDGITHRGLIDKKFSAEYVGRFPNAVDKVHLMNPSGYKSEMYESMIQMVNQDKIKFTAMYNGQDHLTVIDMDNADNESEDVETKIIKLDTDEQLALSNIDAMKEEMVNMIRKQRPNSGKDSFELTPEKANKIHDDRSYCCAMMGYALAQQRRKLILNKAPQQDAKSLVDSLIIRKAKKI